MRVSLLCSFMQMFFLFSILYKISLCISAENASVGHLSEWSMTKQGFGHTGACCPSWQICVCHSSSEPSRQNSFPKSLKHKVTHFSDFSDILFLLFLTDYLSKTTPWPCNSSDFTQDSVWKCESTKYPLTLDWKQGNGSAGVSKSCWFITCSR